MEHHKHCESPSLAVICQEKASAEIRGEFSRTKSWVNFAGDFRWIFSGLFPLEKNRKKISTAKFKSEFGSFAAKIHTARIWPWWFAHPTAKNAQIGFLQGLHLETLEESGHLPGVSLPGIRPETVMSMLSVFRRSPCQCLSEQG